MNKREEGPKHRIELRIEGMTCDSCAVHVRKALGSVAGVISVNLESWQAKRADVITDKDVEPVELIESVREAGYRAEVIRSEEPTSTTGASFNAKPECDLVVIGTGGAGMGAAISAAELGKSVKIIERGTIGGTCVNIGCVPSKALIHAAKAFHIAGKHPFRGIQTTADGVNLGTVIQEKDDLVGALRQEKYIDVISAYENIDLIQGRARLTKEGTVIVDDKMIIKPAKVIVATGARPRILNIEGVNQVDVLTSTSVMSLTELPKSMIVIGGRAVALELGQTFARLGTTITILQRSPAILPDQDPEVSEAIRRYLEDEGIGIITGVRITAVRTDGEEKVILAEVNGEAREFRAQEILMATGRTANTEELGLEDVGVDLDDRGFIRVDHTMRTSNPAIYAAGDVTVLPKFVYVAATSGKAAAENAVGENNRRLDLSVIPQVVFTDPQVAKVGMTESEAKHAGFDVKTSVLPLKHVPRAIAARDTRGLIKLIADRKTNLLLGAHIVAAEAGEMIQTAAMGIVMGQKYGMPVTDLQEMLFPYLVWVEGIKLAALAFDKDVSKLSCCAS